jgi:hypothetical protein
MAYFYASVSGRSPTPRTCMGTKGSGLLGRLGSFEGTLNVRCYASEGGLAPDRFEITLEPLTGEHICRRIVVAAGRLDGVDIIPTPSKTPISPASDPPSAADDGSDATWVAC